MSGRWRSSFIASATACLSFGLGSSADACTRVVYLGDGGLVLTARSMDWDSDLKTNLWAFPRGARRDGKVGPGSLRWTSKYGSVVAGVYDLATTDGMNEKGLVANLLWLAESEYPNWDGKKPGVSIAHWTQYVLDNFATVDEVVQALKAESFVIVSKPMPGHDKIATLHLSVSDASGDSAIFEYIKGRLVVHHDRAHQVMTNSPIFDEQLALNAYWKNIGGTVMLPGTNRAADRFVRASFYVNALPKSGDFGTALAGVFSVIRNASVPFGIATPGQPNIASTLWRTVADQKNLVYYYESVQTPNTFWVDLKSLDFSAGAPARKLQLTEHQTYAGETSKQFKTAQAF